MNEARKLNLREARNWVSGEVEVRLPKAWLAIGGVAVAALVVLALD